MSIYHKRDGPAYRNSVVNLRLAANEHILKWWTPEHDALIVSNINKWQWVWGTFMLNSVLAITSIAIIEAWKAEDPACKSYVWYNVILYFSQARASQLGFVDAIRPSVRKVCPLCNNEFDEDSLPSPFVKRLGIDNLDFCSPCLSIAILWKGKDVASAEEITAYLQRLAELIGRVPPQNYGDGMFDFAGLSIQQRADLFKLMADRPSETCIKSVFGSWLNALIQAGVLESGARKTSRGIHTIATDGHVCLSLGEKTICEFLHLRGISHEKEPPYPEGNYRADFKVGSTLIEYFGLAGDAEYDAKTKVKMQMCKKHGVPLVAVYAKDLVNEAMLEKKLSALLGDKHESHQNV